MARAFSRYKKYTKRMSVALAASVIFVGVATTFAIARVVQTQKQNAELKAQAAIFTKPSEVFDLSNWKLTLPINTPHEGDPDEIKQPELSTYISEYFKLNATADAVTFYSPAGGVNTSKSGYDRSELRERKSNEYSFTVDCQAKDKPEEACWSSSIGYHIMTIDQKITHIPTSKPHVVIGQVHDDQDDVVVFRLEGKKLFVDANRYKKPDLVLSDNYQLGTRFTVAFEVFNDETVYYYNGQRVGSLPVKYNSGYFKAGMYVQSNEGVLDGVQQYGEVEIYNLTVCHAATKVGCQGQQPTPTNFPVPTPTVSPQPTALPSTAPTATPKPSNTPKPSATPKPTTTPKPTASPTASGKITNIKATSPKDSKVIVSWDAYPEVREYKLRMSKGSTSKFKQEEETKRTSVTLNLDSCKNYYFIVDGYDKKGKKIATSEVAGVLVSIGNPVHPCKN